MRVRHADDFAFVLEDQHVPDFGPRAELDGTARATRSSSASISIGPAARPASCCASGCSRPRARTPRRRRIPIDARRRLELPRRVRADTRMIVVEHEHRLIVGIARAAHAQVARTEIAVLDVFWRPRAGHHGPFPMPRTILTMGGNDHPLLAKRMPPLFPGGDAGALH